MINEDLKNLIEKLQKKSINRQVIWNKTSGQEGYSLILDEGSIAIDFFSDYGNEVLVFQIFNDRGETIERLASDDLNTDEENLLRSLHTEARRSYYKVEETIKHISNEIDNDKVIGKTATENNNNIAEDDGLPF